MKTVDFSETIAASDLKVCGSRHLIEYMKICEYWRQGDFSTLAQVRVHTKFQTGFSKKNYCVDLNKTFYESFQVQGNENLMT